MGDAVVAARKAIHELDHRRGKWPTLKQIAQAGTDDPTLGQRLALPREGLFSSASLDPHTGAVPASVTWDREKALAVIAGVAAMAACSQARTPPLPPTGDS